MKNLNVRLPDELHAQLVQDAAANHRSLNAEILARLKERTPTPSLRVEFSETVEDALRKIADRQREKGGK